MAATSTKEAIRDTPHAVRWGLMGHHQQGEGNLPAGLGSKLAGSTPMRCFREMAMA